MTKFAIKLSQTVHYVAEIEAETLEDAVAYVQEQIDEDDDVNEAIEVDSSAMEIDE